MLEVYQGPVRDEPLAIELCNTIYADDGVVVDGLAEPTSASAWLAALRERFPSGGAGPEPNQDQLTVLRDVVRDVLGAGDRVPHGRDPIAAAPGAEVSLSDRRGAHQTHSRRRRGQAGLDASSDPSTGHGLTQPGIPLTACCA
jgi:hypothetical protein